MKRILVGLDGSPRAPGVLRRALDLAKQSGAKLTVLRAVGLPPEMPTGLLGLAPDDVSKKLVDGGQKALEALCADVDMSLVEKVEASAGTPWRTLCERAKEEGFDLLVVGTHGHTVLDTLLGTTAARVVNHAPCSVLVVREGAGGT